ncbi:hypothetical protein H5410_019034 [Solanum commersonii]|uniref:Uncharacterized protein n=1 Tax=Solanum commersonii TaxID=4109 RepID=A0A9J6A4E0_SOLCO|nr:hypothetical protein H5410_019034 [Solanum commersonii]
MNWSLSCADSSLLMPHPCRILQKYTTFGESDTHPLTVLKSPSNIDWSLLRRTEGIDLKLVDAPNPSVVQFKVDN